MPTAENLNPPSLLTKDHDRSSFDCGVPALNDYLKKCALQNEKKHAARIYVAMRGNRMVGYYSLAYGSVSLEESSAKRKIRTTETSRSSYPPRQIGCGFN